MSLVQHLPEKLGDAVQPALIRTRRGPPPVLARRVIGAVRPTEVSVDPHWSGGLIHGGPRFGPGILGALRDQRTNRRRTPDDTSRTGWWTGPLGDAIVSRLVSDTPRAPRRGTSSRALACRPGRATCRPSVSPRSSVSSPPERGRGSSRALTSPGPSPPSPKLRSPRGSSGASRKEPPATVSYSITSSRATPGPSSTSSRWRSGRPQEPWVHLPSRCSSY